MTSYAVRKNTHGTTSLSTLHRDAKSALYVSCLRARCHERVFTWKAQYDTVCSLAPPKSTSPSQNPGVRITRILSYYHHRMKWYCIIFLGYFLEMLGALWIQMFIYVFRHPIRVCCATDYTTSGGDEAYEGPPCEAWSPGPVIRYIKEGML